MGVLDIDTESFIPVGRVEFGWIFVGGGWFAANWFVIKLDFWGPLPGFTLSSISLDLLIVLGIAASLWWLGSRRITARSFALGMVIAYAVMLILFYS